MKITTDNGTFAPIRLRRKSISRKRTGVRSAILEFLRLILYVAGVYSIANLAASWMALGPDFPKGETGLEQFRELEPMLSNATTTNIKYRTYLENFGDVQVVRDATYGDCLQTRGELRHCERDEHILHESLVHPALIAHAFPRKVLIAGGSGGALIREALKHFLLTKVVAVGYDERMSTLSAKHLPISYGYDDILNRVETQETPLMDFLSSKKTRYDVIIVDFASGNRNIPTLTTEAQWSAFIRLAKSRLNKGGILSTRTGEVLMGRENIWTAHKAFGKFKHSHLYTQNQPSNGQSWGFHISFDTDAYADPRSITPSYVDVLLARRIPEDVKHYDGVGHLNMFNLPRWLRAKADQVQDGVAKAAFPVSYEPHTEGHIDRLIPVTLRGETVQREFFGCDPEVLADAKSLKEIMLEGLEKFAHATVFESHIKEFDTYHNITASDVPQFHADHGDALHVVVTITLAEGSVVLHAYPAFHYAVAVFTNFNSWVVPHELFGSLFEELGSARTVGSSILIGPPNPLQARTTVEPQLNFLDYDVSYLATDALEVHVSPTAGKGQFATRDITKGTLIYFGPIEQYLVHEDEMETSPQWLQDYYNHMGENAEKKIWVAPGSFDEDDSYFTNHNCDPNLVYTGYDLMKARRDIPKGAELTFDYATVDAVNEDFKCNCGSPKCRGRVTSEDWKNTTYVADLGTEHFWPHVQKKILLERRKTNNA